MKYYNSVIDKQDYIHSIDMVYVEYFSYCSPKVIVETVQGIHEKYPMLKYQEHLGRTPHSKYDYYLDGIAIGGVYISAGKYTNYDKVTKTFDILPMFEIRVNPNKYLDEDWFQELLSRLLENASSGILRKYDYALDIPKEIKCVKVFDTRKELGIYKGTYYYGQTGRHGYLKIYDKQKDMKRQNEEIGVLTRVEHTIMGAKNPSLENVYVLDNENVKEDFGKLKDTDKAIVEMYLQLKALGYDYDLKLGRKKKDKLLPYIQGEYKLVEYGDILEKLVENIKKVFKVSDFSMETDENGFLQVPPNMLEELPFD